MSMYNNIPNASLLEANFYRDDSCFNNFSEIDSENNLRIKIAAENFMKKKFIDNKLQNYITTLQFLTSGQGRHSVHADEHNLLFKSFDEAILFLIYCCDPLCILFKNSIYYDDSNGKYKIQNQTRKEIGFYNDILLRYEKVYYLSNCTELLTNIKKNNIPYIKLISNIVNNFDKVLYERFEQIKTSVQEWQKIQISGTEVQTCVFNLINQSNILGLNGFEEKMVFFILALDPELKLLRIYEEESLIGNIKQRSLEELGFYFENLMRLERLYHKKFVPNLEISEWEYQKRKS